MTISDPLAAIRTTAPDPAALVVGISVAGEIDASTVGDLRAALHDALDGALPPAEICVDVAELTFIDSSGLAALIEVAIHHPGTQITFAGASATFLRLLELTGVAHLFTLVL